METTIKARKPRIQRGKKNTEYICYDNKTDEIIALGTREECARLLGIKVETFIYRRYVSKYKIKKTKYDIFEFDENGELIIDVRHP